MGGTYSGTAYTDTGTDTFHVGHVAELEVRDVGGNPGLPASLPACQRAYTVMDVNNGPDAASAVQVTLTVLNADSCTATLPKAVSHTPTKMRLDHRRVDNQGCLAARHWPGRQGADHHH